MSEEESLASVEVIDVDARVIEGSDELWADGIGYRQADCSQHETLQMRSDEMLEFIKLARMMGAL